MVIFLEQVAQDADRDRRAFLTDIVMMHGGRRIDFQEYTAARGERHARIVGQEIYARKAAADSLDERDQRRRKLGAYALGNAFVVNGAQFRSAPLFGGQIANYDFLSLRERGF